MKGKAFIAATGAAFALVVPAAQAATSANRMHDARAHRTRAYHGLSAKTAAYAAELARAGHYQVLVHTILADRVG